ncbi:hypothetical protein ANN_10808, partial [Periplaneta americana]
VSEISSKKKRYTSEDLEAAINDVKSGLPKKHNVPRATIQFHLKQDFVKSRSGPNTILTDEEEITFKKLIINSCRKGFARRNLDVFASIKEFLQLNNQPNPFTDNTPRISWYMAFLKRHPDITTRTSEAVTSSSSCVSKKAFETAYGLFPWNPDSIDYSKCLGSKEINETSAQSYSELLPKLDYEHFKLLVAEELIEKFKDIKSETEVDHSNEFYILFRMWNEVFREDVQPKIMKRQSTVLIL